MNNNYPPCPKCGGRHFKVSKFPYPLVLHYILNPGIAINEILLGQCLPKVTLYCQTCQLPLFERTYVPCPHCRSMNNGLLWSNRRAFGSWLGYICPNCRRRIPRLWNLFSIVILIIFAPIWYFPYQSFYKHNYRTADNNLEDLEASNTWRPNRKTWITMSIGFGFSMWLILGLIPAITGFINTKTFSLSSLLVEAVVCSLTGLCFGIVMYLILTRKPN